MPGMNLKSARGQFPSKKMGRPIKFYSALQRDYFYLLEFDGEVTGYETRPFMIPLVNGEHYTPDFLVERKGESVLIDCHYPENAQYGAVREKGLLLEEWGRSRAISYQIVTSEDMWADYLLLNLKQIHHYSRFGPSDEDQHTALEILREYRALTISEIIRELKQLGVQHVEPLLFKMVWDHKLRLPMRRAPITPIMEIGAYHAYELV